MIVKRSVVRVQKLEGFASLQARAPVGAVANLPQSRIVHSRVRWCRITDYIITGEYKQMQNMSKI